MHYLLSRESHSILKRLAKERTLCAFDFDGTLSPIVEHPDGARMRRRTQNLLTRLAALYPCVIISGRARTDLLGKLKGVSVVRVIGNHGAEPEAGTRRFRRKVERWRAALARELKPFPGLWVEDKGLSLAVHYRQSSQKVEARRRILAASRNLTDVRVIGGKQVVNLVVNGAPNKGEALAQERTRHKCSWILYVGDDENDEDAFALEGSVVPVRIGWKQRSRARYYLRAQLEIDTLLERLVRLRKSIAQNKS